MEHEGNHTKHVKRKGINLETIVIAGQILFIVLAIICGVIGFSQIKNDADARMNIARSDDQTAPAERKEENEPEDSYMKLNSFHKILTMFFMNYNGDDTNIYLIIAKYLAAVVAMSVVGIIALEFIIKFVWFCKGLNPRNTLVVGDDRYAQALLGRLGKRGIGNEWKDLKTRGKIVLMGTDEENLQYLQEHDLLKRCSNDANVRVFMRNSKFNRVLSQTRNIVFFSLEEIAARKYWQQHPVEENLSEKTFYERKDVTVSFIGEGKLLEQLLFYGTQMNIYGKDYHIHYQIFGDNQEFESTHRHHEKLGFTFYQGKWWQGAYRIDALRKSDRVIILDQKNPYEVFNHLLLVAPAIREIHIFADEVFTNPEYEAIWKKTVNDDLGYRYQGALVLFNWIQECCGEDLISDEIVLDAIGCNEVYNVRYSGNYKWNELSAFHKYTNALAVELAVKYRHLIIRESEPGIKTIAKDYLPIFGALEHARWQNFFFFFNWDVYKKPLIREAKDAQKRLHADLVPYNQLTADIKDKDIGAVIWLLIRDDMPKDAEKLHDAIKTRLAGAEDITG